MKVAYSRILACCIALGLSACKSDLPIFWNGEWTRTISVPENMAGRCFTEILTIQDKKWQLRGIVHSTYLCNQPFLELVFEGALNEVKIKKGTNNQQMAFLVDDIHLTQMIDVANSHRDALNSASVAKMSKKYVTEKNKHFDQAVAFDSQHTLMHANIYPALLDVAIPDYPANMPPLDYRRNK